MLPKHLKKVPQERKAIAPYNFVELPDTVVEVEKDSLPNHDRYYTNHHTGRIECTLTTSSPLYIRCGWTPKDFAEFGETPFEQLPEDQKRQRAAFFSDFASQQPILPGSSLRGMLRTLVEIVSFGKIERVSDQQRFFFRAVAADRDDPLKEKYKLHVSPEKVKAGYLVKRQDGWFIRPALPVGNVPFVWVKEEILLSSVPSLISMINLNEYRPQYILNISFGDIYTNKHGRSFAGKVSSNCTVYEYQGVLVTSGNMLEGRTDAKNLKRKNHCIIRAPEPDDANLLKVSDIAIQDYWSALTDFQKQEPPFDQNEGVLRNGRSIFYCQPNLEDLVTLFGQSPNFRIPFFSSVDGRAASAVDFIPNELGRAGIIDMADSIFGFVKTKESGEDQAQARSGRVFFSDAKLLSEQEDIWWCQEPITPRILSSPKPTTFQHYLVQSEETKAEKIKLKHYASQPNTETVIRGHKLYWHKGASPSVELDVEASEAIKTLIKPVKQGIKFIFTIYFENLNDVEVGALLWVLKIAADDRYRLSLGLGKPLGMGAVKIVIDNFYVSDRQERYSSLFNGNYWATEEQPAPVKKQAECVTAFESYVLDQISETGSLKNVRRIQMLLAMLSWHDSPSPELLEQIRYMEIERQHNPLGGKQNEYKARRVLPTPLQVMKDNQSGNPPMLLPQKPEEGKLLEAKVLKINGIKVTYEVLGITIANQKEHKRAGSLQEGQVIQVRITALNPDGSIKHVRCAE